MSTTLYKYGVGLGAEGVCFLEYSTLLRTGKPGIESYSGAVRGFITDLNDRMPDEELQDLASLAKLFDPVDDQDAIDIIEKHMVRDLLPEVLTGRGYEDLAKIVTIENLADVASDMIIELPAGSKDYDLFESLQMNRKWFDTLCVDMIVETGNWPVGVDILRELGRI